MHFDILITEFLVFQGDCWICMELMATSLDKFYKFVYCSLDDVIPEEILGKITLAVSFFFFCHNHIPLFKKTPTFSTPASKPSLCFADCEGA